MLYWSFGSPPSAADFSMKASLGKLVPLLLACALALGAAACGGSSDKTAKDVPGDAIALVGDQPVPKADFTSLIDRAEVGYKQRKQPFPKIGSPEYQDLKSRAVQFLVRRYEFRQEAENFGIEVTDAAVTKRLDQIKKQSFAGDEKKFTQELEKLGLTEDQAREEIRDRLIQDEISKKVTASIKVSGDEIQQYYDANAAQFTQPRQIRHILVKTKTKADDLRAQLEKGANFAALAKRFSTDRGSAKKGGRLTATKGQTVPEFDKVAFSLKKGELSDPVKTQFGWHIIQALSDVKTTPFSEVKSTIEQQLLQKKKNSALDTWLKQTEKKYSGEIAYGVGYKPTAPQASAQQ